MRSTPQHIGTPRQWIAVSVLVIAAVTLGYTHLDLPIALYFYALEGTPALDAASVLTHLGEGVYYIAPSLLLYLFFRNRNRLYARAALFIFAATVSSGIVVNLLKVIFGRFRPTLYFKEHLYGFDWFHTAHPMVSFPSGHSATAMGAWVAFALLLPKYRIPLILTGVMLASTRMILTAHYLSDVIAGSAIGIALTLVWYRFFFLTSPKEQP